MVILEVRSIETCPEALLLFLFFYLGLLRLHILSLSQASPSQRLSRPAALKYHTYEFCRPKQNSLFFFFFPFVIVHVLFYSTLLSQRT